MAQLEVPLLGSTSVLNFPSLGVSSAPLIERGGVIGGKLAAPAFLSSAGYGTDQSNQMQHILTGMDDIVRRVNEGIVPGMEEVVSDVQGRSGAWFDNIDSTTLDAKELVASLKLMVDENRSSIDATIANAESVSGKADEIATRVQDEMIDAAIEMLEGGRSRVDEARAVIERIDSLIQEQTPNMRMSMANLRLTADQFKLASMEVRRAPWRLLYRPDTKELEYELLYDAARSYADAVSNLRGASVSLEVAAQTDGSRIALDGQTIDELSGQVGDAFKEYQVAEEKFLGLLLEKAGQ